MRSFPLLIAARQTTLADMSPPRRMTCRSAVQTGIPLCGLPCCRSRGGGCPSLCTGVTAQAQTNQSSDGASAGYVLFPDAYVVCQENRDTSPFSRAEDTFACSWQHNTLFHITRAGKASNDAVSRPRGNTFPNHAEKMMLPQAADNAFPTLRDTTDTTNRQKGTHRQSRWFFICACKAFLPAAP